VFNECLPPLNLFYCYADADKALCSELNKHLQILKRAGLIEHWHDSMVLPGEEWEQKRTYYLDTAHIILLLVSPDFMASDDCQKEMALALARHNAGTVRLLPIILRHVDWQNSPLGKLQALPRGAQPLSDWPDPDRFFAAVAAGIKATVYKITGQKQQSQIEEEKVRKDRIAAATPSRQRRGSNKVTYQVHAHEIKGSPFGSNHGVINNGVTLSELAEFMKDCSALDQ
jgi:hypothetical protein